jgi:serine/threonine protein kinase/Tol biopolymer transport system component
MALGPGDRLGVYEVGDLIGAGGMGEVYRGHDTKLNRSVALKILPDAFARDADRLARFKREAQLLASLNHSNIASIFGFEDAGGVHALVLELVEGPTLADRIAQGPLSLDEALPIARQIADALEVAHSQGIVHRDLKPANIKVRPDGAVKVLDFGLAKALAGEVATAPATQSPTMTSPALTQMGVILGTAAYMSPEQARGKPADRRSDIWAFGAVLYEMLTGKRAFDGDDMSYTLANILKSEPDWGALAGDTPSPVRRVLRRCLEKDPKRRTHDIADARLELDEEDVAIAATPLPAKPRLLNFERVAWVLLVTSLVGFLAYRVLREPTAPQVVRFQIDPPESGFFGSSTGIGRSDGTSGGMLSPDGTQLVFVATEKPERTQLWVRRFDSVTSRPLAGTDDALMPFWSPDSRSVGFFAAGKLKRIDAADGSIQTIVDAPGVPRGATWGSRDVIVFSVGTPPQLARVASRGGEVTPIVGADKSFARWPSFLPDGRHFLYVGRLQLTKAIGLLVGSIEPGFESRSVVPSDSNGAFAAPGRLLFVRGDRLLQQQFDLDRLVVTGEATPVVEQIFYNPGVGRADFSVSTTGVLAFRSSTNRGNQFAWFDRTGKLLETIGQPGNYRTPDLSPDGQRLAYGDINRRDIWIFDLSRQTSSRFTSGPGSETAPVWFPDGSKIAYRTDQGGLFEKDVTGTGTERMLLKDIVNGPDQISPDGKWLLYFAVAPGGTQDVYVLPTTGAPTPQVVVQTPFSDVEPQFSPNVRWLAYVSNENSRNEIYVQAFPSTGRRWQISSSGGRQPLWRADGRELFFVSDDRRLFAVDVSEKAGSFEFGVPQFLFEMRANVFNSRNSYIPSRDGQRFLVNMLLDADDAPITIVHNWQTNVK